MNSETLKNKLKPIVYPIINFIPRRRLKNKNFTIICDNCWAGKVYQELGLPCWAAYSFAAFFTLR